ncbi:MAG: DNA alkylation repair protein [Promethearchaeota archaeon]
MIYEIINEIKSHLKKIAPHLTEEQRSRMYAILNSSNSNFVGYGIKHSDLEKYVRDIQNKYNLSYHEASQIFKVLIESDVHDEKMAGIFLLNRYKKEFNNETIDMFYDIIPHYYDTWAVTDTSMIRVIGPFLGKKDNYQLAEKTIKKWSNAENLWVKRASLVILLKLIMIRKEFDADYVFKFVEKISKNSEEYIQKGIGWLLKTCSKYEPDLIFNYLMNYKDRFPRLILRYASEKLSKEKRAQILKKPN